MSDDPTNEEPISEIVFDEEGVKDALDKWRRELREANPCWNDKEDREGLVCINHGIQPGACQLVSDGMAREMTSQLDAALSSGG